MVILAESPRSQEQQNGDEGPWSMGDGSSWARVATAPTSEGTKVLATPLSLTSLADDVTALNRSLECTEGPIVLAGHAYGGAVIALARPERMKALVYVTALAPDEGEKVADVFYRLEPHPQPPKLAPDTNGLIWLPEGAFETAFTQHASPDDRAVLAAVQRPISVNCITVPAFEGRSELVSGRRRRSSDRRPQIRTMAGFRSERVAGHQFRMLGWLHRNPQIDAWQAL
jgi:pimeloyl-ACP methyl ester carboxylesterase